MQSKVHPHLMAPTACVETHPLQGDAISQTVADLANSERQQRHLSSFLSLHTSWI